jgi:hypothetical protein
MISTDQEPTEPITISSNEEEALSTVSPYRFVRCNPRFDQNETIAELTVCMKRREFAYLL